jgi:hypothetical protein
MQAVGSVAESALQFGKEVKRLDIASVPDNTQIDLVTSGDRSAGDPLQLRIAAFDGSGSEHILATRTLLVERAERHIHMTVSMIWLNRPATVDESGILQPSRWQPAASYSVLVKRLFGSAWARRSSFYSDVLDPGVGLNLSAPDFNHDDTPELAAGPVVSIFRDYIQGGGTYNLQQKKWVWFIGFRLPVPSATLPTVDTSSQ